MGRNDPWGRPHTAQSFLHFALSSWGFLAKTQPPPAALPPPASPSTYKTAFVVAQRLHVLLCGMLAPHLPTFCSSADETLQFCARSPSPGDKQTCSSVAQHGRCKRRLSLAGSYLSNTRTLCLRRQWQWKDLKKELRPCSNTVIQTGMCWYCILITQ